MHMEVVNCATPSSHSHSHSLQLLNRHLKMLVPAAVTPNRVSAEIEALCMSVHALQVVPQDPTLQSRRSRRLEVQREKHGIRQGQSSSKCSMLCIIATRNRSSQMCLLPLLADTNPNTPLQSLLSTPNHLLSPTLTLTTRLQPTLHTDKTRLPLKTTQHPC